MLHAGLPEPQPIPAHHCSLAGDLLTALLMAWMDKHPSNLKAAVEKAVAGLQGILQATAKAAGDAAVAKERDSKVRDANSRAGNVGCFRCPACMP